MVAVNPLSAFGLTAGVEAAAGVSLAAAEIPVGVGPFGVAVTARNVYVANSGSNTVSVIDV